MVSKKSKSKSTDLNPGDGYYEMNIRVGTEEQIKQNIPFAQLINDPIVIKQMQEMALSSINDNYTRLVFNFIKNGGQLTDKDSCQFKAFDLEKLWNQSEQRGLPKFDSPVIPNFDNIKQYTRLTIICDDPKVVHQIIVIFIPKILIQNLSSGEKKQYGIINSYDLLAVRTSESEQLFEQICTKSDVDIISIDLTKRLSFFISKVLVKQALQRGIQFEICYGAGCFEGSQTNRKQFLQNVMQLVKVSKGKGIILSCEANNSIYQRTPIDCIQMQEINMNEFIRALMFGMGQREALMTMQQNAQMVLKHSHMRKTYKGVAELVLKENQNEEEEEKMQM
ncbi:rnase p subunit p30 family protein [Stylonychia lemnae]|uniref:Rnase p subunit p30 family protein n=1 Tax=Stylonychia lemnae TaxID=5949 RepID=A0A078BAG0_STYLE|nr:rnase p subunit p30 family protein [Stylonychia lemnae]|eukprot:CDW90528.1 rnase p subunit p30 family protein [Stylonychia lemnae]